MRDMFFTVVASDGYFCMIFEFLYMTYSSFGVAYVRKIPHRIHLPDHRAADGAGITVGRIADADVPEIDTEFASR